MIKWALLTLSLLLYTSAPFALTAADATPPQTQEAPGKDDKAFNSWMDTEKTEIQKQDYHFGELFVRMLVLLAVTITLLYIFSWLAKRFLNTRMLDSGTKGGRIQILEKRMLSPKTCVYLIQVDNIPLLVGESAHQIKLMKELTPLTDLKK